MSMRAAMVLALIISVPITAVALSIAAITHAVNSVDKNADWDDWDDDEADWAEVDLFA